MRTRKSTWFETKVRIERTMDDGLERKVTEQYTVEAVNWTEAEAVITGETGAYGSDFEITDIKKAVYGEVFFSDNEKADKYYKCKLAFITIDERTQKEKRNNVYYLVQAENIDKAKANIDEAMLGSMIDYEVLSVVETKILEVLYYRDSKDVDAKETKPSAKAIKAFKDLEDSVPKGQKVTISTTESDGVTSRKIVEIDKTGGGRADDD